jgi:hypothetical protein
MPSAIRRRLALHLAGVSGLCLPIKLRQGLETLSVNVFARNGFKLAYQSFSVEIISSQMSEVAPVGVTLALLMGLAWSAEHEEKYF